MTKRTPISALVSNDDRLIALSVLDKIKAAVLCGDTVVINGFGTFRPRIRPEGLVRNPATGEMHQAPASTSIAFRPSKAGK